MKKLYEVHLTITAVILADSESHAMILAERNSSTIVRDYDLSAEHAREIKSLDDLTEMWDGECIPYGGDNDTKIKDLLK